MRNRTKKEQKQLDEMISLLILVAGIAGWYLTGTLKGAGIVAGIGIGIVLSFSIWRSQRFKKRMQQSGIYDIDKMTGRQFEEYVGTLFVSRGYKVIYTPTTGDYGADLILKKEKDVIVVQAKRYKQTVGVKAVQEVIPSMRMYDATAAWVITNSTYTKQAQTLAKRNHVRMIDREELISMSIEMKER
ncbi:restriction endonuclease [Sporosarcina sp. NPDC096371]|uniref:restriction endonuclease n=1 Tax=Sporosarcina sp. NPDC096371 TaxID=3364530 RepID=UPI003807AB98